MPLIIASIKNQESLTASATTFTEDIRFGYNVTSFHLNAFALKVTTTASTVQNLVDKITRIKINTTNGTPESTWDGDDAFNGNATIFGIPRYTTINSSADNVPHAFGIQIPQSPQPQDPTRNFGMPAGKGIQFVYDTAADVAGDYDAYTTDLTVEGLNTEDKPSSLGYVKYMQDTFTPGAVAEVRETKIGVAKRLCGVQLFETTSFDDLAAAAAFDVTSVRTIQVTSSDQILYDFKPYRNWSMQKINTLNTFAAAAVIVNVLDSGSTYHDFGINNASAKVGLAIAGNPNVSVKTTAGVADATRVNPIVLV